MSGFNGSSNEDDKLDFAAPPDPLEASLSAAGVPAPAKADDMPAYRVLPGSKIAVSKLRGKLWKSRKATVEKLMRDHVDAWDEAIRYYNHDQSEHRDGNDPGISNNRNLAKRLNDRYTSTENIVFSNVSAAVPQLYAKNPIVSVTAGINQDPAAKEASTAFARAVEKLVNVLFAMSHSPGVNAKPKMKRATVVALLTNAVWIEVGYTKKDDSSESALADLMKVSQELAKATKTEEILECEGKLIALEEKVEFLNPSGPWLRVRLPHQVLVDPDHNDSNGADARWFIIDDMLPTSYLNAVYGKEDENTDQTVSIYEPTHILDGTKDEDEENFSLFTTKKDYNSYGFTDETTFHKAKRTKVSYVWDGVTRRLELYADNNWTWPIWVWDDPYQLQGFFPFTKLWFHENPIATYAKGEVSYYLDQQDQINEINDEKRRALYWARRNIFFNKNKISQAEVEKILKGPDATATGLDVPEGQSIKDIVFTIPPPSTAFTQMFDKTDLYKAVDRIAATNEVERGGEFKTNTTNKAVDYYATQGNQRNDERLDAIEDCIGRVGWQVAQLCLRFMQPDQVQQLTGLDVSDFWKALDPLGDVNKWSMTCVGGSTQKQTKSAQKQEAVQVTQVLAQFVKAAPAAVLTKSLEIFERAFDDVLMQEEDWDDIQKEVLQTLQMSQGGAPGANQAGAPGAPQPGQPMPQPGGSPGGLPPAQEIVQALSALPPQMLKAIGVALTQGATPQQIFETLQQSQGAAQ